MQRFCTNCNSFSIVSVDPTFSLGDFSVTCIVYRHLLFKDRRTGESPIMLGPVLVHQRKLSETYHYFISSLIGLAPHLDSILAFGTDGEEALVLAFKKQLKFAVHLRCFRHMKQNILRKLKEMAFSQSETSEVMLCIFGGKSFFEGLVDTESEQKFDERLLQLQVAAEESAMLKPIRISAGLGDPPAEFCTMIVRPLTAP